MPNQRAPGQKLVSVPMKKTFVERIDAALVKLGYSDRAKFIREAIIEKLKREGIEVPPELASAPSRAGKGGRPRHRRATKNQP